MYTRVTCPRTLYFHWRKKYNIHLPSHKITYIFILPDDTAHPLRHRIHKSTSCCIQLGFDLAFRMRREHSVYIRPKQGIIACNFRASCDASYAISRKQTKHFFSAAPSHSQNIALREIKWPLCPNWTANQQFKAKKSLLLHDLPQKNEIKHFSKSLFTFVFCVHLRPRSSPSSSSSSEFSSFIHHFAPPPIAHLAPIAFPSPIFLLSSLFLFCFHRLGKCYNGN